jgi:hypothetical protein
MPNRAATSWRIFFGVRDGDSESRERIAVRHPIDRRLGGERGEP